jgi:hypothetical protein
VFVALLFVALSIVPFVAVVLWFYFKAKKGLGPRSVDEEAEP